MVFFHWLKAKPHSSVGSVENLRTRGRWFNPQLGQYSGREMMIVTATDSSSITTVHCVKNGYVRK